MLLRVFLLVLVNWTNRNFVDVLIVHLVSKVVKRIDSLLLIAQTKALSFGFSEWG